MSSFNYRENGRGIHAGFVGLMVLVLLLKTVENEHSETALTSADKKVLLQTWYRVHTHAEATCNSLQSIFSEISRLEVWNNFFFIQKEIKEEKV